MKAKKVPFIRQLSEVECGPACLAMILTHYGRDTSVADLRELLGAGRDGVTASAILHAAREEGLAGRGIAVIAESLSKVALPAIVHWKGRHYVVLEQVVDGGARIVDPAVGRRLCTVEELRANVSGTALEFSPSEEFRLRRSERWGSARRFLRSLFREVRHRRLLGVAVLLSAMLQAFSLAVPLVTALVIDGSGVTQRSWSFGVVVAAVVAVVLLRGGVGFGRALVGARLQRSLDEQLSREFFEHLLRLPYSFFKQRAPGDLLLRLSSNSGIREVFTSQLQALLLDAPSAIVFLALLLLQSPALAAVAVLAAALQVGLVALSVERQRSIAAQTMAARADEQSCAIETLTSVSFIKAAAAESQMLERWLQAFARQQRVSYSSTLFSARLEVALGALRFATPLVAVLVGALQVQAGAISLGMMVAATSLVGLFVQPVLNLLQSMQALQLVLAYIERVADVLETEPERTAGVPLSIKATGGGPSLGARRSRPRTVECLDVGFSHSRSDVPVLESVSFEVKAGSKVAIVGPSGSGKSTLLKILLGLWMPTSGEVRHNNIDLRTLCLADLRARSGIVLQEPEIFGGSIRDNIAMRRPDASLEEVKTAARLACVSEDVERMPLGYHTSVGDRGGALSGGQRQRLAIARALLDLPDLLLLDEATSNLDMQTEARINAVVRELGCTTIMVSHRLSAVTSADWAIALVGGRVFAQGRPNDVMRLLPRGDEATSRSA